VTAGDAPEVRLQLEVADAEPEREVTLDAIDIRRPSRPVLAVEPRRGRREEAPVAPDDAARREVGETMRVETQLIEGPPAPAILRVAQEEGFDLIVLASRGLGQISGLLLGSVSSAVAQRAHCAVLIVH